MSLQLKEKEMISRGAKTGEQLLSPSHHISVRVTRKMHRRVKVLAAQEDVSMTELVSRAIEEMLAREEAIHKGS